MLDMLNRINVFKFTCPFCFHEYNKADVLYCCPDCEKSTTPGKLEREPIKCRNEIQDLNGNTKKCPGYATQRKCPYCGSVIPKTVVETKNLPFSIVGVSNSGKTNYITVMLHELSNSSGLRLALAHQTQETLNTQNENWRTIHDEHKAPPPTIPGEAAPLIWTIKNLQKKHGTAVPTYSFTVFDGAGEDHENNLDPSSPVCGYIKTSKAIILTIDPLVLPGIRNGSVVNEDILINSLGGDTGKSKDAKDVLNSVAAYIKSARGLKSNRELDIPIAVVLTKIDTIINHRAFGPNALIKNSSLTVRNGLVDMAEIEQIDAEIKNFIMQIGEKSFLDALESNFKDYRLFGVSSYGAPPREGNTLPDEIKPHRVLDPILWLFKREKFID